MSDAIAAGQCALCGESKELHPTRVQWRERNPYNVLGHLFVPPEGRPVLESAAAALRDKEASEIMASGILLREEHLKKAVEAAVEQNTSLIGELAKLKLEHSALAKALEALVEEVAPGDSRDSCLICGDRGEPNCCPEVTAARAALRLAGRLP